MAERYIPEHRRNAFKAKGVFKPDELRRRREEQQVEIRKTKREENLAKRRGIAGRDAPGASLGAAPDSDDEGVNTEAQVRSSWRRATQTLSQSSAVERWCFVLPFKRVLGETGRRAYSQNANLRLIPAQRGPPTYGKRRLLRPDR